MLRWRAPRVSWGSHVCLCSAGPRGRPALAPAAPSVPHLPSEIDTQKLPALFSLLLFSGAVVTLWALEASVYGGISLVAGGTVWGGVGQDGGVGLGYAFLIF